MFSKITAWYRVFIVLSISWLIATLAGLEPWRRIDNKNDFLIVGLLPLIVFWGIVWIVKGFKQKALNVNLVNLKKGLNRVIIILAFIAAYVSGINGFYHAEEKFKPTIEEAFASFTWNDISLKKYYETAKRHTNDNDKNDPFSGKSIDGKALPLDLFSLKTDPKNLPNFKKNHHNITSCFSKKRFLKFCRPLFC